MKFVHELCIRHSVRVIDNGTRVLAISKQIAWWLTEFVWIVIAIFPIIVPYVSSINNDIDEAATGLKIITRGEWYAQPPDDVLENQNLPAKRVIITHTGSDNCTRKEACVFHVRFIQTFHMESRHWDDIAYNYLVGGDGAAYEGRTWDKVGVHTKGYNLDSQGIAFIGTFTKYAPPNHQLRAAQLLIEEGVRTGKISPDYKLYGHRQLIPSESPGQKLYEIIQSWPHWSNDVE